MSMRHKWELSASNLRICIKLFSARGFSRPLRVAQFQWITLQDTWYLYNTRSKLILASVRRSGSHFFIRYRTKTRYRSILEKWGQEVATVIPTAVVLPSDQVGRWERRMRYLQNHDRGSRDTALVAYTSEVLNIPDEVALYDGLTEARPPRRRPATVIWMGTSVSGLLRGNPT